MTRVVRGVRPTNACRRAKRGTLRKHKIILESVTQEKKKLRAVVSFEVNAPEGFTFIPAGNPYLTSACKELCRKDGLRVFAVSTTPHQRTHDLSQQVHRIGYHFPSAIVANACMQLGLYLNANGKAMPLECFSRVKVDNLAGSEASQTTINTEARDVIRDLFPNIPENDINMIISTAFQKGQRKVGTAAELPLARRAQLAVVAHIRHMYTEYDKLLKKTTFPEARRMVESSTLQRLVEWRGDDENGKTELEDVFREVIVISDDDESDTDQDEDHITSRHGDPTIESVSHDTNSTELKPQGVDCVKDPMQNALEESSHHPDPETMSGTTRNVRAAQPKVDRRGFSRYKVWEQARNQWRERQVASGQNRESSHIQDKPKSASSQKHPRRAFSISGVQDSAKVVTRGYSFNRYYQVSRIGHAQPSTSLRDQFDPRRGSERGLDTRTQLSIESPGSHHPVDIKRSVLVRSMEGTRPIELVPVHGSILTSVPHPEEINHRKRRYTPDTLHHSRSYDEIHRPIIPSIENPSSSPHDEPISTYYDFPTHRDIGQLRARSPHRRRDEDHLSRRLEGIALAENEIIDSLKKRRLGHPTPFLPSQEGLEFPYPMKSGHAKPLYTDTNRTRDSMKVQGEQTAVRGDHYRPDSSTQYGVSVTSEPTIGNRTSNGRSFPHLSSKSHSGMTITQENNQYFPHGHHRVTPPPYPGRYAANISYDHPIPERTTRSAHLEDDGKETGSHLLRSPSSVFTANFGQSQPLASAPMESKFIRDFSPMPNSSVRPLSGCEIRTGESLSAGFHNNHPPFLQEGRISQSPQNHKPDFFAGEALANPKPRDLAGEEPFQHRHSGAQIASHKISRTERLLTPWNSPLANTRNTRLPVSARKRYMSQKGLYQDLPRIEVDQRSGPRDADHISFSQLRHDDKPSRHSADPYKRKPLIFVD